MTVNSRPRFSPISPRERALIREAEDRCQAVFEVMNSNLMSSEKNGVPKNTLEWRRLYLSEIYRAVQSLYSGRSKTQIEEDFRRILNLRPPYSDKRSIFSLAIQAYERDRDVTTSKQNRSIHAAALEYAKRHNIAPDGLAQFLFDIGGVRKAAEFSRDPEKVHFWAKVSLNDQT